VCVVNLGGPGWGETPRRTGSFGFLAFWRSVLRVLSSSHRQVLEHSRMLGGLFMCLALRRVAEALRRVGCDVDLRWVRRFSAGFMCRFGWWVLAVGGGVRSRCRCWQVLLHRAAEGLIPCFTRLCTLFCFPPCWGFRSASREGLNVGMRWCGLLPESRRGSPWRGCRWARPLVRRRLAIYAAVVMIASPSRTPPGTRLSRLCVKPPSVRRCSALGS